MRAVVVPAATEQPVVADVPAPTAPRGGVVVRVGATGVCRSDWHAWAGPRRASPSRTCPATSWPGVVVDGRCRASTPVAGPATASRSRSSCGCGRCEWCRVRQRTGLPRPAAAGLHPLGLVRRARRPARRRHEPGRPCPSAVDVRERGRAWGAGSPRRTAPWWAVPALARGEWVTVVGAGGVGLSAVMIARALGRPAWSPSTGTREALAVASASAPSTPCLRRRHRHAGRGGRPDRRRHPRRRRRRRQRADLRRRRAEPAPPRPAGPGRAAATGRRVTRGCRWRG